MSLTTIKELDMIILSYLDLKSLDNINSYFADIINDQNFWKLRLKNILGLKSVESIDYKSITQFLDNGQKIIENYYNLITRSLIFDSIIDSLISINNNFLFLLIDVVIPVGYLRKLSNKPYEEFINIIVDSIWANESKDHYIVTKKHRTVTNNRIIKRNKITSKYFDKICAYDINNITIDINKNKYYQHNNHLMLSEYGTIKIDNVNGFSNGKILYEFAKLLPEKMVIETENGMLILFDGLYYDNGMYYMSDCANISIDKIFNS